MTRIKVPSAGPQPAKILIIGEAPGASEERDLRPFSGSSGLELTRMLHDVGIMRTECRVTNVCKYRPPGNDMNLWWAQKKKDRKPDFVEVDGEWFDPRVVEGFPELEAEIRQTNPNIIVPLGNLALWALTRNTGITRWRGSLLRYIDGDRSYKVVPTIHPAAIMRQWEHRWPALNDLRRVKRWMDTPEFPHVEKRFIIRPTIQVARDTLLNLLSRLDAGEELDLAADIETSRRQIACLGIAWTTSDAICIPFITNAGDGNYWSAEEELELVLLLRRVLTHPRARVIGQNWQYDYQYFARQWGFEVNLHCDIMSEHHCQFPGLPKGLDFQSSLYRQVHVYWKDDGKDRGAGDDDQWWTYNCEDCIATLENYQVLMRNRAALKLKATAYGTPHDIQQSLSSIVARASARGVRLDNEMKTQMIFLIQNDLYEAEKWLNHVIGHDFNCRSTPQMFRLFYEEMGQEKILDRKTHRPTLNDEALDVISKRDVLLKPLCNGIKRIRSLSNYLSVCTRPIDGDQRMRCQYIIPGTETYRFSSKSDPFDYGMNLQNITSGDEDDNEAPLPNLRKLFIPDPGFTIGDFDLPQADARVVAWEAEDESLIELFLDSSRHLHLENAEIIFGRKVRKSEVEYYYAKQGVHLTNYGGSPRVLAMTLGITMREAENFQARWFSAHPKIKDWQERVRNQLQVRRYVENKFGYRRFYFDRIDNLLKEALAWIPQSTVGISTNLGIRNVCLDPRLQRLNVQFLLQVHDSAVFQWPTVYTNIVLPRLKELLSVTVPYDRPLVFTPGSKISTKSWGDCE